MAVGAARAVWALLSLACVRAVPATSFVLDQATANTDNCLVFLELMVFNTAAGLVSVLGADGVSVNASIAGNGSTVAGGSDFAAGQEDGGYGNNPFGAAACCANAYSAATCATTNFYSAAFPLQDIAQVRGDIRWGGGKWAGMGWRAGIGHDNWRSTATQTPISSQPLPPTPLVQISEFSLLCPCAPLNTSSCTPPQALLLFAPAPGRSSSSSIATETAGPLRTATACACSMAPPWRPQSRLRLARP
jgi:hypothetical protein